MIRVGLIGGPGSGKTTLANALTAHVKSQGYPFDNISEYARDFINEHGAKALGGTSGFIGLMIFDEQRKREDRVPEESEGFVTDAPLLLSYGYALAYAKKKPIERILLAKMYEGYLSVLDRYDYVFHVARQKTYVEDGTRRESAGFAKELDGLFLTLARAHGIIVHEVGGTTEERVHTISRYLGFLK